MTDATLTKKIHSLERRVRLLETQPALSYVGPTSWLRSLSKSPNLTRMEEERREKILKETSGVLQAKLPKDLVAWQRAIRAEWK